MKQNRLFERSRWRLASWYATIISIILLICAVGVYQAVAHAHQISINQELKSVAGTLHDSLLPVLQQPGKIEPEVKELLPNTCLVETGCYNPDRFQSLRLGVIGQDKYYLRLFDLSENLVAVAGMQPKLPQILTQQQWETLTDSQNIRYQQISFLLHTQQGQNWGYLQVGRSLQDVDRYVDNVRWVLLLGVPLVVLLVAGASWWLSELAIRPIYQSYRQMQQFTADAAHELRTPLAAIQATAQSNLMLPILSETEARNTLSKIVRQNKRLSSLVADLLTLCRIDGEISGNQSHQKREKVALANLIIEVEEDLAALAMASEIELASQVKVSQLEIIGDRSQLYRLITNLVTNAIQYTTAGGKVIISLTKEHHQGVISVRDTGIGIAKNEQKRIFDRFYRVDKARSRSKGGSGLGLAIAKAIALAHHGSLEVESEIGRGSNFILRLPQDR
ncbi:integral membrane sensor signal transduction histidine kinase (plasmid) [Stanieria cyanosphaera PCC 7437]|uniref:histidine kinase n=1 Tax=Stanieria cyanosphaera (strain ATCC 29371 / PCC 7437) TaxID=111780 RepID=K9Y0W5_STAC7|nr:two-component system sensor histidine kinase RppB [Stanieria cyanosphaera]AFZ37959.1 integral membrane sensor signal transduction histidine kinase [Stanieria cyanosphaera PCC 7437]